MAGFTGHVHREKSHSTLADILPARAFSISTAMLAARRVWHSRSLSTLPYRIRSPLAKLRSKKAPVEASTPGTLGDGEALETGEVKPDYLRMALTSRVYDFVGQTPLVHAGGLSETLDSVVHLKREDLNPSYSFYIRGAFAKLADLKSQGCTEVITVSIGSRGYAIACAARRLGIHATIVMPEATPQSRSEAVARKGATVLRHGASMSEAQAEAARRAGGTTGLHLLRAHDDPLIIAGNATVGIEITRQHGAALSAAITGAGSRAGPAPKLDAVFVPVGGGSLLAGVASAVKQISPTTKVSAGGRACGRQAVGRTAGDGGSLWLGDG